MSASASVLSGPFEAKRAGPDTERVLILLGAAFWLGCLPVLFVLYRALDPSPDQSIFDYIAWLATQGRAPYVASFEVNWPGQIVLHILGQLLFGPATDAFRSLDFFLLQAATLAGALALWRSGLRVAAALFLAVYPVLYVTTGVWMAGQRDIVAGEFLVAAILGLSGAGRGRMGPFLAGAAMACAIAIRPTYLAFLGGILLLELRPVRRWRGQAATPAAAPMILAGAASVVAALILAGIASNSLQDWYDDAVRFAVECYAAGTPPQSLAATLFFTLTRSWSWITLFAVLGALAWALRSRAETYPLLLWLGAAGTAVLSFVVQNRGFGYHLGGLLPILAGLMAVFVDTLVVAGAGRPLLRVRHPALEAVPRLGWLAAAAAVLMVIFAGATSKVAHGVVADTSGRLPVRLAGLSPELCESPAAAGQAAAFIARTMPTGGVVLPINCGYRAALMAERLPASRYATSTSFGGHDTRCALAAELGSRYVADLRRTPPELVMIAKHDIRAGPLLAGKAGTTHLVGLLSAATGGVAYARAAEFGELVIFRRVDALPPPAA